MSVRNVCLTSGGHTTAESLSDIPCQRDARQRGLPMTGAPSKETPAKGILAKGPLPKGRPRDQEIPATGSHQMGDEAVMTPRRACLPISAVPEDFRVRSDAGCPYRRRPGRVRPLHEPSSVGRSSLPIKTSYGQYRRPGR